MTANESHVLSELRELLHGEAFLDEDEWEITQRDRPARNDRSVASLMMRHLRTNILVRVSVGHEPHHSTLKQRERDGFPV